MSATKDRHADGRPRTSRARRNDYREAERVGAAIIRVRDAWIRARPDRQPENWALETAILTIGERMRQGMTFDEAVLAVLQKLESV